MVQFGSRPEALYAALIGDVVRSRASGNRGRLQRRLLEEIERLNSSLEDRLARPLALTAGDEIQGLFRCPSGAVTAVVGLSEAIFPESLVFGLGYGGLSTDLYEDVARIDGPCFHRAREALREAGSERWLTARGLAGMNDSVLTSLFTLMQAVRRRWTDKQLEYVRAARRAPQKEVARDFGVSPSTVSESLKAAGFKAVREGEETATGLLAGFGLASESNLSSVEKPK